MSACEICWDEAFRRSRLFGGHQADHYRDLLEEIGDDEAHAHLANEERPAPT